MASRCCHFGMARVFVAVILAASIVRCGSAMNILGPRHMDSNDDDDPERLMQRHPTASTSSSMRRDSSDELVFQRHGSTARAPPGSGRNPTRQKVNGIESDLHDAEVRRERQLKEIEGRRKTEQRLDQQRKQRAHEAAAHPSISSSSAAAHAPPPKLPHFSASGEVARRGSRGAHHASHHAPTGSPASTAVTATAASHMSSPKHMSVPHTAHVVHGIDYPMNSESHSHGGHHHHHHHHDDEHHRSGNGNGLDGSKSTAVREGSLAEQVLAQTAEATTAVAEDKEHRSKDDKDSAAEKPTPVESDAASTGHVDRISATFAKEPPLLDTPAAIADGGNAGQEGTRLGLKDSHESKTVVTNPDVATVVASKSGGTEALDAPVDPQAPSLSADAGGSKEVAENKKDDNTNGGGSGAKRDDKVRTTSQKPAEKRTGDDDGRRSMSKKTSSTSGTGGKGQDTGAKKVASESNKAKINGHKDKVQEEGIKGSGAVDHNGDVVSKPDGSAKAKTEKIIDPSTGDGHEPDDTPIPPWTAASDENADSKQAEGKKQVNKGSKDGSTNSGSDADNSGNANEEGNEQPPNEHGKDQQLLGRETKGVSRQDSSTATKKVLEDQTLLSTSASTSAGAELVADLTRELMELKGEVARLKGEHQHAPAKAAEDVAASGLSIPASSSKSPPSHAQRHRHAWATPHALRSVATGTTQHVTTSGERPTHDGNPAGSVSFTATLANAPAKAEATVSYEHKMNVGGMYGADGQTGVSQSTTPVSPAGPAVVVRKDESPDTVVAAPAQASSMEMGGVTIEGRGAVGLAATAEDVTQGAGGAAEAEDFPAIDYDARLPRMSPVLPSQDRGRQRLLKPKRIHFGGGQVKLEDGSAIPQGKLAHLPARKLKHSWGGGLETAATNVAGSHLSQGSAVAAQEGNNPTDGHSALLSLLHGSSSKRVDGGVAKTFSDKLVQKLDSEHKDRLVRELLASKGGVTERTGSTLSISSPKQSHQQTGHPKEHPQQHHKSNVEGKGPSAHLAGVPTSSHDSAALHGASPSGKKASLVKQREQQGQQGREQQQQHAFMGPGRHRGARPSTAHHHFKSK